MYLKGFLEKKIKNFRSIRFGVTIKDKLCLLKIAVLLLVPSRVQALSLSRTVRSTVDDLSSRLTVKVDGIKYVLVDYESFEIITDFEGFIQQWFRPLKGDIVLDIGAHIGKYTLSMAKAVGEEGMVLAIEGNPNNFHILNKNLELNQINNVNAINVAAWSKDCNLELFIGDRAGHHSTKINWHRGSYNVKASSIDHIIKKYKIKKIDWIKIDVEGAEWEVLEGLHETIKQNQARIIIELFYPNLQKTKKLMDKFNYGMVKISPTEGGFGAFPEFAYFLLVPYEGAHL